MTALRFTLADLERANDAWGANCGPASLAAICGLTLDEARAHFPDFPGYTNQLTMFSALVSWSKATGRTWPRAPAADSIPMRERSLLAPAWAHMLWRAVVALRKAAA